MMSGIRLTQGHLKEILHYDADKGVFFWKVKKARRISIGAIAGSITESHNGSGTSYIQIMIDNKKYGAHRLAWLYVMGVFPDDQIDHEDGNGLNNRWCNIRSANQDENMKNLPLRKDNSSGVCGVSFDVESGKWVTYININKKRSTIGRFKDIWDAICARKSAENKHKYHANHGRRGSLCQA